MPGDERYSRQILFPPIGEAGQEKFTAATVAVVGCGATGSVLCGLMARAGIGHLRIIDRDYVELSNLQRQSLFDEADAAESLPKAIAAARRIATFNSGVVVQAEVFDLVPGNIEALLRGAQIVLDGTDNFETRFLINDFCVQNSVPWIYAAAVGAYGVTMSILPGQTACLACLFPAPPGGVLETCDTAGILNSAANMVASIAVTEALKILVGATQALRSTLLSWNLWTNQRSEIATTRNPDCKVCGHHQFDHLAGKGRAKITLCGRNSVQIHERERQINFSEISARLQPYGQVKHNDLILKFWHKEHEITLFPDGRAIIKGTTDPAVARTLYARFIGN